MTRLTKSSARFGSSAWEDTVGVEKAAGAVPASGVRHDVDLFGLALGHEGGPDVETVLFHARVVGNPLLLLSLPPRYMGAWVGVEVGIEHDDRVPFSLGANDIRDDGANIERLIDAAVARPQSRAHWPRSLYQDHTLVLVGVEVV